MWPKSKVPGATAGLDLKACKAIEDRWNEWAVNACSNGESMAALQKLAMLHLLIDGEVLVIEKVVNGVLKLSAVECDQLDVSKDVLSLPGGGRIIGGIEMTDDNLPIAYHLLSAHPGEKTSASVRVPAEQVHHVFERNRASQVRGICSFASIVQDIFDTVEYQDSTLILAKVACAYGIFIETPQPGDWMTSANGGETPAAGTPVNETLSPAEIRTLLPGEKPHMLSPNQPGPVYKDFIQSRLRGASAGSGISYETFSNDYSQASYSSARQAMIIERALFRQFSGLLDEKLNEPIFRRWLAVESLARRLVLPGFDKTPGKYQKVKFSRPRHEWIDPLKEANACGTELNLGITTRTTIAENRGEDIDQIFETLAAEKQKMIALGIYQQDADVASFGVAQTEAKPDAKTGVIE
jgi:lambda family phage portal protein